jgi:hypothetical protein
VTNQDQVLVPVVKSAGLREGEESLPVALVGPARFRLLHSLGFVEGLAAGDEFVLDGGWSRMLAAPLNSWLT